MEEAVRGVVEGGRGVGVEEEAGEITVFGAVASMQPAMSPKS